MIERKMQSKKRYILAFLIGTGLFIIGFVLSYSFSYLEYQRISGLQEQISYDIFQDKIRYSFFNENPCINSSFLDVTNDLRFQGRIIDDLEKKFGKNDERVLFRKKYYSLIELEHFEFVKLLNKICNKDMDTLLFFYSNEPQDVDESEAVGRLLEIVYNRNDNLIIYSFDVNLESMITERLIEKYSIEGPLTIVINEKEKLFELKNIDEVEELIR